MLRKGWDVVGFVAIVGWFLVAFTRLSIGLPPYPEGTEKITLSATVNNIDKPSDEKELDYLKNKALSDLDEIDRQVMERLESVPPADVANRLLKLHAELQQKKDTLTKSIEEDKRLFREIDKAEEAIDKLLRPSDSR
ncbi:MAG: hypothetical protein NT094_00680 [Candidatus Staskawiczbacteria bacterium]|nr:hypothetical protein [Candidatus Staskawiczbacteria bacterium]